MEDLFETLLIQAIEKNVTDIHLKCQNKGFILFRIKGELIIHDSISKDEMKKLINYVRYISNIDLNYSIKPQTGHYIFQFEGDDYNLRVSNLSGHKSDTLVIRILNHQQNITIHDVTQLPKVKDFIHDIIHQENGLFVIAGATGSGKSTTLYAILDEINECYNKNIISIEDPIEIKKEYCLQIQLNENKGITYEQSLVQILRHDPDVIMIGEIRNAETAKLALTCALTGHLVLTTIHSSHCVNTIKRFENLGISSLDLSDVLVGIMNQKLKYDCKGNVVIISEFMNQINLKRYFENKMINYYDFDQAMKDLKYNVRK